MTALVLAFDTATEVCALALGERDGESVSVLEVADFTAPRAALGRLLPAVSEMLSRRSLGSRDLDEVVVGRGPGSFTGVRIGVATAKGLAHGLGVPLFGVGTLDAVAWSAATEVDGLLGVVGDAMRGEVYPALFEIRGGRARRLEDDRVRFPTHAAEDWAAADALALAGNGLRKHSAVFEAELGGRATVLPEARWAVTGEGLLAAYANVRSRGAQGDGDPALLLPIYTRLSDAEENERLRAIEDNGCEAGGQSAPDSGVRGPEAGGDR